MAKEIGPREKALREMREQRFEQAKAASREVGALREKVAAIPARKAKVVKKKRAKKGRRSLLEPAAELCVNDHAGGKEYLPRFVQMSHEFLSGSGASVSTASM